jgi:hypothetical protein
MIIVSRSLAVAALGLVASLPAQAATMKAVVTGTIYNSYDQTGVFGDADTDLNGKSVTVTYIYDPEAAGYRFSAPGIYDIAYGGTAYSITDSPGITTTVKVGSVSQIFDVGYSDYFNAYDYSFSDSYDYWFGQSTGDSSDPETGFLAQDYVYSHVYRYYDTAFDGDLESEFEMTVDALPVPDSFFGYFSTYDYDPSEGYTNYAYGYYSLDRIVVSRVDDGIAPIPLPATGWLLLGALAGASFLRRRRG